MKVGLGVSTASCESQAIREALSLAVQTSGAPSFLFLFTTPQYNPGGLIRTLREAFPSVRIFGCSAQGVIAGEEILLRGVVVLALSGEGFRSWTFAPCGEVKDPYILGKQVGERIREVHFQEGTVIALPNPSLEIPLFLQGMYNVLGPRFLYLGGGAERFRFTEEGCTDGPVSIGVFEGIGFSSFAAHGWLPTRELLVVTKTRGREVIEIDGISPFQAYRERLGDFPEENLSRIGTLYPLGFPNVHGEFLIRDPAYFTPQNGAMGFVGASVPQGAVGYIMRGERENLLAAAEKAGREASNLVEDPLFALVFDCVSRFLLLGKDFQEELARIRKNLGKVPICGFLSVGEIHPYGKAPLFRNKTVVVAVAGRVKEKGCLACVADIPLEAELAILHEISALSIPESYRRFLQEIVERAVRLFGVQRMAFFFGEYEAFWGFSSREEVEAARQNSKENQWMWTMEVEGQEAFLFLEAPFPLTRRERRLYTVFAKKIEEILHLLRRFAEREQRIQELEYLSLTDELTGLYNRRGFLVLAEHALEQAQREQKEAGILFLDLDNLKWINDRFGHEEGDRVLQEFSRIIQKVFRKSDILARIGGDEFVVFLKGVKTPDLQRILSRLRALVEEWNKSTTKPYRLSFSAGWAPSLVSKPQRIQELLSSADARMYREKRRKKEEGDSFIPS